ncbi:DUF535 family protein [Pseudomonas plecoglossicida]|uniref:DUF535 domain-containing protein n=3 Tax=Pseudomonas plecoglossicida TaxID=70775 RepID=A0AAD0VWB6_PSEDL|nr:DUF535 family protein [Pseudomonas plecoglossicida]AXM98951.1 DUF535 domain-containing protein [Pseudomonas plecoglossicida]QLB55682.1 DUF535 family protein [Pseudomonas plecoglossicida]
MNLVSLASSLPAVHPGYSPRALKNRLALALLMVRQWPRLRVFMQRLNTALGEDCVAVLGDDCIGILQWPYISKGWDAPERLAVVASHYEVVAGQFPSLLLLGRDDRRTLADLSAYSQGCTLVLDRPMWFKREGELVLNLFQGELRVASLAFSLCRVDGELCLLIGAVQGIHKGIDSETSLNIYRDLTKDFEGLRPRSLLIEATKCVARLVGAAHIHAVSDAYRHHRHPYFGADTGRELAANYDTIWQENGAQMQSREGFFAIPLIAAKRSADDIAPKKRAMYRRRHALLDDLFGQLEAALPDHEVARQLSVHHQRLASALAMQQDTQACAPLGVKDRLTRLLRQFMTEPRPDQRFIAYLRKAGLYPTLKKAFRELLKHGPALLWKPADSKRKSLPLDDPSVPASELFPRELLVICESDLAQGCSARPSWLQHALQGLGYHCQVLDWRDGAACMNALQTASVVIFHRLPATVELLQLLEESKRLKVSSIWDVDALIFDPQAYRLHHDLSPFSEETSGQLLAAVNLYQQALLACDRAIASTPALAKAMLDMGVAHVTLVEWDAAAQTLNSEQLGQLFPTLARDRTRRVLAANIFFAPRSFGGATVVAEQMARLMVATTTFQQFIFTSLPQADAEPYSLYRYEAHGAAVIGMGLPDQRSAHEEFENPATLPVFDTVLKRVAPDLVHMHSIQGLSALLADSCRRAGLPFVVTLHDCWWICGRHFMIDNHGKYCGQTTIRADVCARCVDDPELNDYRQAFLASTLKQANLLLAPSHFARNLYIANGFDAATIRVNRNGILPPAADYHRHPGKAIRFGFVGGNATIKGIDVITRAFAGLQRTDYELRVVDNLLHLGFRSLNRHSIKIPGTVSIVPGYTQANMDEFFAGIDVLLFPTQSKETFGLAVREALVRDVWVISTHAGGTVEDIVDGVNGTLIPLSADEKYLRQALVDILEHPERYRQHRNTFKQGITLCSDQALELQAMYDEVLKASAKAKGLCPQR